VSPLGRESSDLLPLTGIALVVRGITGCLFLTGSFECSCPPGKLFCLLHGALALFALASLPQHPGDGPAGNHPYRNPNPNFEEHGLTITLVCGLRSAAPVEKARQPLYTLIPPQ